MSYFGTNSQRAAPYKSQNKFIRMSPNLFTSIHIDNDAVVALTRDERRNQNSQLSRQEVWPGCHG